MNASEHASSLAGVPTLTEVVEVEQWSDGEPSSQDDADLPPGRPAPSPLPTEAQLTRQVMAELERQIDVMLEYRLREVLAPLLARAADTLVRDARGELASTLRDVVARAVENELARHRGR